MPLWTLGHAEKFGTRAAGRQLATQRIILETAGNFGTLTVMIRSLDELERRIDALRAAVRGASMAGDRGRARELRAELRQVEQAWDDALAAETASAEDAEEYTEPAQLVSVREQVHQALTLLGVAAAPKLIAAVHGAFFVGKLTGAQLTSLRRDEERSFRSAPHARSYYLCSVLTFDRLVAARGLVAVSTWPLELRIIGPLSHRVDFLTAATRLAEFADKVERSPPLPALRLLWQFASNIPGAADSFESMAPAQVAVAARAELDIHSKSDQTHRESSAARARKQLDEVQQLFGSVLKVTSRSAQT